MPKSNPLKSDQEVASNAEIDNAPAEEAETQSKTDPVSELNEKLAELENALQLAKKDAEESKNQELRALAELENFKKRKELETQNFKKYAAEKFVAGIIPILDSLDQAIKQNESQSDNQGILDGVKLIHKQFVDALAKEGVSVMDALNQPFNPELHQAISQQKIDGVDSDIVINEMQKGYLLHDRVIRPAMVVVSE